MQYLINSQSNNTGRDKVLAVIIERIYFDPDFFATILLKLEQFFFKHFAKFFKALPVPAEVCAVPATPKVTVTAV